jgi:hypothetical protein
MSSAQLQQQIKEFLEVFPNVSPKSQEIARVNLTMHIALFLAKENCKPAMIQNLAASNFSHKIMDSASNFDNLSKNSKKMTVDNFRMEIVIFKNKFLQTEKEKVLRKQHAYDNYWAQRNL